MSLKTRISSLENAITDKPPKAVYQDWDNPDLWHTGGPQEGEAITWGQVLRDYSGYYLIRVEYGSWK